MAGTVSIAIPTFRRPAMLRVAVESVWGQTERPAEILIGDDSDNDETERLVLTELAPASPVAIRYFHHRPALREARNIAALFREAAGDYLIPLHDDDLLQPVCVEQLRSALEAHPDAVAAFGLQVLIAEDGTLLPDPAGHNRHYLRTPDRAGVVDGVLAGTTRMFPNNGYLIRAEIARQVGYDDQGRAGRAVDFYFGFRVGRLCRPMVFVPVVVSAVRILPTSASRSRDADNAYRMLRILEEDSPEALADPVIARALSTSLPAGVATACRAGDRERAWRWIWSPLFVPRWSNVRWWRSLLRWVGL